MVLIEKYIMNPHLHSLILPNLVDRRKELKVTTLYIIVNERSVSDERNGHQSS